MKPDHSDPADRTPEEVTASTRRMIKQIVAHGHEYDFFQLTRLLERALSSSETSGDGPPKSSGATLRFRPSASVVFPATDVKRVEWSGKESDPVTIVASFLGLYGFDSSLHAYFSGDLQKNKKSTGALRAFLDIFNNRLYAFYYRAWKKYRPALSIRPDGTDMAARRFLAVSGTGARSRLASKPDRALRMAAFAGHLGLARSADGLKKILQGYLPGIPVIIEENVPRWVWLSDRARLGRIRNETGTVLGETATIGERVRDLTGKFRIVLGPMDLPRFEACLPGREEAVSIQSIVDHFLTDILDYDVELRLNAEEVPPMVLGETKRRLGLNTWLRRPREAHAARVVSYENARTFG